MSYLARGGAIRMSRGIRRGEQERDVKIYQTSRHGAPVFCGDTFTIPANNTDNHDAGHAFFESLHSSPWRGLLEK